MYCLNIVYNFVLYMGWDCNILNIEGGDVYDALLFFYICLLSHVNYDLLRLICSQMYKYYNL